jgi:hypothetical protein
MHKVLNLLRPRKQSTKRVDAMASGQARAALDQRLHRMLAQHALLPVPQPQQFKSLSNPVQTPVNS